MLKDIISATLGAANGLAVAFEVNLPPFPLCSGISMGMFISNDMVKADYSIDEEIRKRNTPVDIPGGYNRSVYVKQVGDEAYKTGRVLRVGLNKLTRFGSEFAVSYAIFYGIGKVLRN